MSVLTENFEELQLTRIMNITELTLDMPLLSADFGDGYGVGILYGKESGLRYWSISAELLPDLDEFSIDYDTLDDEDLTDTRFQYFWEFFRRHMALGNKPFYFRDPRTNRIFLASFIDTRISFESLTSKLYRGGVPIKQRRVKMEGLEYRTEDGSIPGDSTVPTTPGDFTLSFDGLTGTGECEPATDEESDVTDYILDLSWSS